MDIDNILRPIFRGKCLFGDQPFFNARCLKITEALEHYYSNIQEEYKKVMERYDELPPFQEFSPHQKYISNDDKWKLFFLRGATLWFKKNCLQMPYTYGILKIHDEVVSAYISVLGPNKRLNPHFGPYSGILRLHLALDIPDENKCYMEVAGIRKPWIQGKCMLFDDTYEHFAVNDSDKKRAVLFMDILKPLPEPWNTLNRVILFASRFFPFVFIPWFRHKIWERKFYKNE
jgi:aspartyl/asparaginyl beta-hydroxylase (cupin superfamily)|tara:strand:+ start:96 stop:788 length:693 start_codon:yes stop_codon:yes gene_type:complete